MENEAHLFLDSNVLLHYEAIDSIQWAKHVKTKTVTLHIAQSVMEEVSLKKDMGETKKLRKRAGQVTKRLLECLEAGNPFQLRKNEVLFLETETPRMEAFSELNPKSQDDRLVASALTFLQTQGGNCYVVTGDSSLTLRVKLRRWNLQHVAAPEDHRLADEPDAEERQRTAMQKELEELRRAQPKLELTFITGEKLMHVQLQKRDIEAFVNERMSKIREKNPILPIPNVEASPVSYHVTGSPADVRAYNNAVETFYEKCESWLRQVVAIKERAVEINLEVFNRGSVPAESVLVNLHFPDGFKLIKAEALEKQYPKFPKVPKKPGFDRVGILPDLWNFRMPVPNISIPVASKSALTITKTNSYDVEWEHQKLRQNTSEPLDELMAVFESKLNSFEIIFQLRADNLRAVVSGSLYVVVP